ncbi:hypothetical protein LZ30DRAFT_692690 [Colletotrichum cereale]|nr:hypothetical protein LZ30DRAFT_692690 [Colletotrichum cereale]
MASAEHRSGSGRRTSSQSQKGSRHSSSASALPSSPRQQEQLPNPLSTYFQLDRRARPIASQPHQSPAYNDHTSDAGSSVGSWNSTMGSAGSCDVKESRRERRKHAQSLQGPPLPSSQRPIPEEPMRGYGNGYGTYQNTAVAAHQFSDQFGQQIYTTEYPRYIELDSPDTPISDPRSDSSRSKSSSSRKSPKHRRQG